MAQEPNIPNCQCYTGIPHVNLDGSCGCHTEEVTGGIKAPWPLTSKINHPATVSLVAVPQAYPADLDGTGTVRMPLTTDPTKADDDGLIFGFSPLVVLGAAAVGLFLLSSMDGKK